MKALLGEYIDFGYYGDFYKDAYPSEEKVTSENSAEKISSEEQITEAETSNDVPSAISIDPFAGIQYVVSGISPYCRITINNQKCSDEVQMYVTYSFDKEKYANGETSKITAILSTNTGKENYVLTRESSEYEVSGQSEYVTQIEQIDMDILKNEVTDKITAMISASIGTDTLFGEEVRYNCVEKTEEWEAYKSQIYNTGELKIKNVTENMDSIYFSLLKKQKENQFSDKIPYNMVSFLYCLDFSTDYNVNLRTTGAEVLHIPGKMYINIIATNIVKKADGSIYWNDESCNFNVFFSFDGIDNLTSNTIMINSDNYNISKVS